MATRLLVTLWLLLAATTPACTIPVFRFALDRWEADPFRLVIPASWAAQPEMMKLLVPLRGNGEANIRIEETTDPSATEARLLFPQQDTALWSGRLDATTLPPLLDSPARQELLKRVLAGDSVVWVVCTTDADKAETDRIEKRLGFLEQVAALPTQDPNDPDSQLGLGPPLKLKFSVLRLSLDQPEEKLFAAMLAGPAQQQFIAQGISFAAAVFGKGRVLGSWPLAQLDDPAIEDASLFLIGRCSCRIKHENPGWDVVLKADWERLLEEAGEPLRDDESAGATPSHGKGDAPSPQENQNPPLHDEQAPVATVTQVAPAPRAGSPAWSFIYTPLGAWLAAGLAALSVASAIMLWIKR